MIQHKKNTAYYLSFPAIDSATPSLYASGVTIAIDAYYKDGAGVWTALAIVDTITEIGASGMYELTLSASELNHDKVMVKVSGVGLVDDAFQFDLSVKVVTDLNDVAATQIVSAGAIDTLSGAVVNVDSTDSVTGSVGSVVGNVDGSIGSLGAQAKLDVNTEADTANSDYGANTIAPDNTTIGLIDAKTTNLPVDPASIINQNTINSNVSAVINDLANGIDGLGALKVLIDAANTAIATLKDFDPLLTPVEVIATGGTAGGKAADELIDDFYDEPKADHRLGGTFGKVFNLFADASGIESVINDPSPTVTSIRTMLPNGVKYLGMNVVFLDGTTNHGNARIVDNSTWDGTYTTLMFDLHEPFDLMPINGENFLLSTLAGHSHTLTDMVSAIDDYSTKLDVAVSTRNSVVPDNTSIGLIQSKTTNLPVDPASETNVNTRSQAGDAMTLLPSERTTLITSLMDFDLGSGKLFREIADVLRCRVVSTDSGGGIGTITVYKADDVTVSFIADTTLDPSGLITSVVPRT